MADFDQAIQNLERFIGLVMQATSAVEQVEEHVAQNGRSFEQLEHDAEEGGGGLNDGLQELLTTLESEESEAVAAIGELAAAGKDADGDEAEVQSRVDQAAADLEQAAGDAEGGLEQASGQLVSDGFEPLDQAFDEAQAELETTTGETGQALTELATGIGTFGTESEAAWGEAEGELDTAAQAMAQAENELETEAQEGVQGFDAAADALEGACQTLVAEVDQIYDALDTGIAAQGDEWKQGIEAAAQEAATFVNDAHEQRVEPSAAMVEDDALSPLNQEYEAVGTLLDDAATPLNDLEPLSAELTRAQSVVGRIDELMAALG